MEKEFQKEKKYIFTGSLDLIERKKETLLNSNELGNFIQYFNVAYHGEFYEKGKAEFEMGYVNFPYYNKCNIKA
jgi:hypothetical protein